MKSDNHCNDSQLIFSAKNVCAIISSYNRKVTLNRAVSSVLDQSSPPGQLLIVDDGSTDNSVRFIENLQKKHPQIELLSYPQNRGPSFARNFAVQHTKKKFLAFLDSDDAWSPQKLEFQLKQMQSSQSIFSATKESWIRNDILVYPPKTHQVPPHASTQEIFTLCLQRCILATSTVILSKDLFVQVGGFNPNLPVCEDFELWLRCLATESFCYIRENLSIKYGGRPDQVSSQFKRMQPYQITALFSIWNDKNTLSTVHMRLLQQTLLEKTTRELHNAMRHREYLHVQQYQKILDAVKMYHLI